METLNRNGLNNIDKICDALCYLVTFLQLKKCEKHPWKCASVQLYYKYHSSMGAFHAF